MSEEEDISEDWVEVGNLFLILAGESLFFIILIIFAIAYTELSKITSLFFLFIFLFLFLFTLMSHIHFHGGKKRPHYFSDSLNNPIQINRNEFLNRFQQEFQLEKAPWLGAFNVTLGVSRQFMDKNDETVRVELNFYLLSSTVAIILSRSAIPLCQSIDECIDSYIEKIT